MKTIYAQPGKTMHIGRVGENLATEVVFDISHWFEEYGVGIVNLLVEQNGVLYIPEKMENTNSSEIRWIITNENTAVAGLGRCELYYSNNEFIVKSDVYDFIVTATLDEDEIGVPPVPFESWFDKVISAANEIQGKYDSAEEILEAVQEAKTAAETAQTAAATSAETASKEAEKAADGAETAINKAGETADNADLSKQWAEGTFADGSKSAREWSIEAENTVSEGIENIEQLKADTQNIYNDTVLIKDDAESARTAAIKAKDDAEAARDVANNSAGAAAASEANASESARLASKAQAVAENVAEHPPRIGLTEEGENPDYWYIWNRNLSKYEQTDYKVRFSIIAVYYSVDEMNESTTHQVGDFVIVSNPLDEVKAVLYVNNGTSWTYVTDLTGYEGIGISSIKYMGNNQGDVVGTTPNQPGATDTYLITYTDGHTKEYYVYNGKDGYTPQKGIDYVDGIDGFSPTIQVEDITNGHKVIITNKDGSQSFEILNGKDGEGSGDMHTDNYDPNNVISAAGGIENYVKENTPKIQLKIWTAADLNN